jgi:hypothetical protein
LVDKTEKEKSIFKIMGTAITKQDGQCHKGDDP